MTTTPTGPLTASHYLREAKKLIARGWCQRAHAHTAEGERVDYNDPAAVAWCTDGAILNSLSSPYALAYCYGPLIDFFAAAIGTTHHGRWNDAPERTHADVLAAFDAAIALATAAEDLS